MDKNVKTVPVRRACAAGAIGVALALLLTFVYALCAGKMLLPQGRDGVYGRVILLIASACAAYLSCRRQSSGKAACAGISGLVMLAYVLFLGILIKASSVINISLLYNFLCIISGAFCGCLLTAKQRRKKKRR